MLPSLKLTVRPMKIPIFPGKYHQNGGFSMALLVYRSVVSGDVSNHPSTTSFRVREFPRKAPYVFSAKPAMAAGASLNVALEGATVDGSKRLRNGATWGGC